MTAHAGELVTETFDYDGGRQATVYVPSEAAEVVVFAADSGWHLSRLVDAIERAHTRSTMIVGIHGMDDDGRFREYVPGVDPERFREHGRFVDEVRGWVGSRLGVALAPDRTAIWGASLGGEFALAMGFAHPEVFGAVFSASPGGGYRPPASFSSELPATYLVAGNQEPFFVENATRWADALRAADARVQLQIREGDHGDAFWFTELPLMIEWAFGADGRSDRSS